MVIKIIVVLVFIVCGSNAQQFNGEKCTTDEGGTGKCIPIRQCSQAIRAIQNRIYVKPCGFTGNEPLVCCGTNAAIRESISQRKCREYATFVPEFQIFAIVGGVDTEPREFPHMAALGYTNGDKIMWQCGGSLVSENYVLTAGHCLLHISYGKVSRIRLAVTVLPASSPTSTIPPTDYLIANIIPHPAYRPPSTYNDIALLRLARSAQFSPFVKPACLSNQPITTGEEVIATGWGLTDQDGERSEKLQKVGIEVYSGGECNRSYENIVASRRLREGIKEGQFCAGGRNNNHDTCQGDSGGPLQTYMLNERIWSIMGVTSFGKICGGSIPGVNTKVSYYIPWLESVIWPN